MKKITPFLWFDTQAEEAARFYVSIFRKSRIVKIARYPEGAPGRAGSVMTVKFELEGDPYIALNGGPMYRFNESISFVVDCESQEEVDHYWDSLVEGGTPNSCGWLRDKYGLSWQVIPRVLHELLAHPDHEKAARVMQAMLKMQKIDIAALQQA